MHFGELAGNTALKRQLSAEIDAGRFPHALLIEGQPGSGRRTLARQIAAAAVCTGSGEHPCGVCAACRKTAHPDVTLLDGSETPLSVDAIRQVRREAFVMPNEAPYRVMLLAEAQTMTVQAQNALLKILEEPPAQVLFLLTCENRTQMLDTIRSRCITLTMQPVEWAEAAPVLRARLPDTEEEQLRRAHSLFGGWIGQVLAGVCDGTFREVLELTPQFAAAVIAPEELPLLLLTARLEKNRELTAGVLSGLRLIFRDALALSAGGDTSVSTAPQQARLLAGRLNGPRLMALAEQTERLQEALRRNMNNTLFLTRMCACLRQAAGY